MKISNLTSFLVILFLITGSTVFAQVKIGGQKASAAHPSAVLELADSAKGFLMPRLTQQQMVAVKTPANGLLVYNTSDDKIYVYRQSIKEWKELLMAPLAAGVIDPEDEHEWVYEPDSSRVYLRRGLIANDTVFYSPVLGKMIFADRYSYSNSLGQPDFNVDRLGGKWVFKSTASKMTDSLKATAYTTSIVNEIDDAANTFNDFHSGLLVVATKNPKSTQVSSQISGVNINAIHAGQDTSYVVSGLDNAASVNGNGYAEEVIAFSNNARINSRSRNDVLNMYGITNSISRSGAATGRITGNVFGYQSNFSGLSGKVDGTMYGIYLGPVQNGTTRRNYSIYTNRGLNRFGDSVLVTDNFSSFPRAVFDINSTSAMIMPNGNTAQRPATNVQGMLRYNNTINKPEYNNGISWLGIGDGGEWVFNALNNRVELTRGLPLGDSVFYSTPNKHFIFSDRFIYTNSQGLDFNSDQLGGKFVFKSTASKMTDSASTSAYTSSIINEVDNASNTFNDFHSGLLIATTVNPKSFQTSSQVQGINISSIHAGQDTVYNLSGIDNAATVNGNGYAEEVSGINNSVRISSRSHNDVLNMYGIRNTISRSSLATGRITGDVFGYQANFIGLTGKVDGGIYGIFLGNVPAGVVRKNYAIFSNKGINRFGDSMLVTDNFSAFPRAVFDINSTSAMIMPNGTTAQRPVTNVQGMLRYNNTGNNPEFNNGTKWISINTDSSEWVFDNAAGKINMKRPLALGDSIFYSTQNRHMIFGDRTTYSNSLGDPDFSVDRLGGKFTFKSTASQMTDSASTSIYTASIVNEIDNASNTFNDFHSGLLIATTVNPKSTQTSSFVQGANISTIHAGQDSVFQLSGMDNLANVNGNGYTDVAQGFNNTVRMSSNSRNNVGSIFGIRNTASRLNTATGKVTGNVYGYFGSLNGFAGKVDGTMYGIYMNSIANGTTRRNYSIYTNAGLNRFGDSVLITNTGATLPRAVVDINATSAMIIPTGTTAARPATGVTGMVRYNTDNGGTIESFNGASWNGIIRNSQSIDIPNIGDGNGTTITVSVPGATIGSSVSVSPTATLSAGIVIAWARVSVANTIEIRFHNAGGSSVNPPAQNFAIRVIQ